MKMLLFSRTSDKNIFTTNKKITHAMYGTKWDVGYLECGKNGHKKLQKIVEIFSKNFGGFIREYFDNEEKNANCCISVGIAVHSVRGTS